MLGVIWEREPGVVITEEMWDDIWDNARKQQFVIGREQCNLRYCIGHMLSQPVSPNTEKMSLCFVLNVRQELVILLFLVLC